MERRHFEALAARLAECKPLGHEHPSPMAYTAAVTQWERCINYTAQACTDMNPRFDKVRFRKACGL